MAAAAERSVLRCLALLSNLILSSRSRHRYNEQVVARSLTALYTSAVLIFFAACWLAACAAPLGPGYIVEKQQIRISFVPLPSPRLSVVAEYRLKNTGDRELTSLDVRFPSRHFHPAELSISWDGT